MTTHHGDLDWQELHGLGLGPADVLDFSTCVNPYGPSPRVRAALAEVSLSRYPDRQSTKLRLALAEWLAVKPANILVGNGTSELIWLICLALLRPGDRVLVPQPTYGEYARAAGIMQAEVVFMSAAELPVSHAAQSVKTPRLVFLCNPNNPTGTIFPAEKIAAWAEECPGCLFVVDEAYLPFCDNARSVVDYPLPNILVLRSMTKDFALAGLRLGFMVGPDKLCDAVAAVQPPWSVNAMAQAAGLAALGDLDHVSKSCTLLRQARHSLCADLRGLGLAPLDSAGHFFLVKVGPAAAFRQKLLRYRIVVRDCASFGLPEYVRIATRRPEENARLVRAIKEIL